MDDYEFLKAQKDEIVAKQTQWIRDADAEASTLHDLIYAEPFDREAASKSVWRLHEILRAQIKV